ncbi:MAG: glycoside hydrolase family 127 protein [Cyclobacteriaceae bacterium]|nr:glycoside hydrolase family 127 protein [Cyclobacteriaceae bacterium]
MRTILNIFLVTSRTILIILTSLIFPTIHSFSQAYLSEKNNALIRVKPVIPVKAYAFSLHAVRLLDGSPFKHAQNMDAAYLLSLEPDRLLHRFHLHAGLPVKGEIYRGWESDGLSGHTLGHYLSACAMMYASTGNAEFKKRTDYLVDELARCQQARGSGYVGAIPKEDSIFWKVQHGIIKTSGFDLNGGWSPWYTVHKVMAGLTDVYVYTSNIQALDVVVKMADWTGTILKDLNEEQLENMRKCEYGGMNDVLVHIYELTGNKKYLGLSYKFHDQFVLGELAKKIDPMPGKHSNTNVPKVTGVARRYAVAAASEDHTIASFFWETMVNHHSYVIGGNSNYEYCGDPDKLNDRLSDNTCETCNTYNMLKLTRYLFAWNPNSVYGDYYERALYNHILASQHPENGMMTYFVPLRMGSKKTFSTPFNTFTCCVGSGMENHAKYTEGIYYEGSDGSLMVNLFIPSELSWKEKGVSFRQETKFPEDNAVRMTVQTQKAQAFQLKIRQPKWTGGNIVVKINGKVVKTSTSSDGFFVIDRKWKNNDVVELTLPMTIYTESIPDNPDRIALLYGPLVLAGQLGNEMPDPVYGTTVLMTTNKNAVDWIKPVEGAALTFRTESAARPQDVKLIPFYKTYDQYYNVYWDFFTPEAWSLRQADYEAEKKRISDIESRTIDYIRIGEMQPERDHNLRASERSYVSQALGRPGREVRLGGYFEFDMKVDPAASNVLLCSYIGDDRNRSFDFLVDGVKIATQELNGGTAGRFFDVEYPVPDELVKGKSAVVIRVQAHPGKTAGRVFGCRIVNQ